MRDKIIISMTSYPGRINNIGLSIYFLLTQQTLPPDEIHLWLSEEEFKNKLDSLPDDLRIICTKHKKVKLHWLQKNTYVHKRHEIFKYINDDCCVFFIDDDVRYNDNLIKTVMDQHEKNPNCIICYNNYSIHSYKGKRIEYKNSTLGPGPHVNKVRWCGQSMIPSKLYPKEILSDEYQDIRNNASPISDECWFQPWVVYNDIPIYYFNFGWGTDIDKKTGKNTGICSFSHKKDANGFEKRDIWLNNVLYAVPKLLHKYQLIFNYSG